MEELTPSLFARLGVGRAVPAMYSITLARAGADHLV